MIPERKNCSLCGAYLPKSYKNDICPNCEEIILFSNVKDYIRNNRVNEFQVAEHFNISLRKVKGWIKEGRIEYVLNNNDNKNMTFLTCAICNTTIKSGYLCPRCESLKNKYEMKGQFTINPNDFKDEKMRYLEKPKNRPF